VAAAPAASTNVLQRLERHASSIGNRDARARPATQAPPAWMFAATAGPNKKYLQKMEAPKKDEKKQFRAKFLMNSYIVARRGSRVSTGGVASPAVIWRWPPLNHW
jgi:hypothetical protein